MRRRLISVCIVVILVFCIFGCGQTVETTLLVEKENAGSEDTESERVEETGTEDTESESEAESEIHNNKTVNASGITLRDDTALLVTVTEYVSPTYNQVYEEYEYDSENRLIKSTHT